MIKCEVLSDTAIAIKKGSIVLVDERQFELARKVLKPCEEPKVEKKTKKKEK